MAFTSTRALQAASGLGEYTIDQSLRFDSASSAYLSRTPASAGNRKTYTFSCWVKLASTAVETGDNYIFTTQWNDGTNRQAIIEIKNNTFGIELITGGSYEASVAASAKLRDPSSWYHLVMAVDTTQATSSDRIKIYINGVQQTDLTGINVSLSYPSQNFDTAFNAAQKMQLCSDTTPSADNFDGYLAEVHFIDGQALTPDSFGEVDDTYGHWKPKRYTGSYGTNGFYLPFSGTFYNDASGNGNNWTANNLAATDVVLDSPTNNFCTLNPVSNTAGAVSEGNLKSSGATTNTRTESTIAVSSGKWYFEVCPTVLSGSYSNLGIGTQGVMTSPGEDATSYSFFPQLGQKQNNGSLVSYGSTVAAGGVVMVAFDLDNNKVFFGANGTWFDSSNPATGANPAYTISSGTYCPAARTYDGSSVSIFNFGQDSSFAGNKTAQNNTDDNGYGDFYYSPPSGFLAICTANLSDPAVVPGENFNAVTYTGAGTPTSVTGVGFQPDLGWFANRAGDNHPVYDALRGTNRIYTNLTAAESSGSFSSWDSDGFTVNADGEIGDSGGNYVAWLWKADNTSGSSNTDGSITSTVAANVDAGFSMVSYTGNGTNGATVGHGLSQAPEMIIVKQRTDATGWAVYNKTLGNGNKLFLNDVGASSSTDYWHYTSPTSSLITLRDANTVNGNGDNLIAYCFHSVDGYSKFGSYIGNGSTDGTFVYTGFRPAYVMVKCATNIDHWLTFDSKRDVDNPINKKLSANSSGSENSLYGDVDFLSNGFKPRTTDSSQNGSGQTYIYMAFAEYPFKYTTAR